MPESATASSPAQDFTPIPVQADPSTGSAPPIVPSASPKEINVGKEAGERGSEGARKGEGKTGSGMDEAFGDLERLFGETESKPGKGQEDGKTGKREDETPGEEKPSGDDSGAKEGDSGESYDRDLDKANAGKPVSAPELRKAYEKLKAEVTTLREQVKSRGPSPEEIQTWKEQYEGELRRRTELERELAQSAYERSPEFMEKHATPFRNAYQNARNRVSQFKVTDSEGNTRQASADDFDAIMQVADDMEAATLSRELFGDTVGPIVMMQREKVQELHGRMQEAIKGAEENFEKTQKERKVQSERQTAHLNKLWKTLNDGAAEKYPQLFKPIEGDEKGNELLQKGFELVDKVFMDSNQLAPEEAIKLHSQVRNRAAAFGRLVYQNRQKDSKIAELEKALAQYKDSEPKNGEGKQGKKVEGESWEAALDRYVNK